MDKIEEFKDIIETFAYKLGVYTCSVEHRCFYNEGEPSSLFIIKYKIGEYGKLKKYDIQYVAKDADIECEFTYTLSSALQYISDEIINNRLDNYLLHLHERGVI